MAFKNKKIFEKHSKIFVLNHSRSFLASLFRYFFRLKNEKGQIAIFIALMFQVLFAFFAMIVNVGLLVHHKINLQNSADFAAYYGAMKQAETLNVLSHINYQIRQSFKLLSFRYQQLGSAGLAANGQYPYSNLGGALVKEDDSPLIVDSPFCIPYTPWDLVTGTETYCKDPQKLEIPLPGVPSFGRGHSVTAFQTPIINLTKEIRNLSANYCRKSMALNWLQLAKFIAAYKVDVRNRKKLFYALAKEISSEAPRDIEGASIKEGVYKTLFKNLSYPNQESIKAKFGEKGEGSGNEQVDFKYLNSFSMDSCRGNPSDVSPPAWIKEILIYPIYALFDGECNPGSDKIIFKATYLNSATGVAVTSNMPPHLMELAKQLSEIATEFSTNDPNQLMLRSSLGFEKNPWCVGYSGVSVKTTPKIPFAPLGSVTLKATSFAKPFGGRLGPWYGTKWPSGAEQSDSASLTDSLLPYRVASTVNVDGLKPDELKKSGRLFVNHSRYKGDSVGIVSNLTVGQFAKAIHERMIRIKQEWWDHIQSQDFDDKNSNGDLLAWDLNTSSAPPMRNLEIAAIAPDHFDTTYYSIDPDFYNNYLKRIQKGYGSQLQFAMRSDLGSRMQGSDKEKMFSVRNQIETLKDANKPMVDWNGKLTYYLTEFGQILTSWQQKNPDEYILDSSRFGKCLQEVKQDEVKFYAPGSCKAGGRTGYSVKLVDGKFLQNNVNGTDQDFELGGNEVTGKIKNPPPEKF